MKILNHKTLLKPSNPEKHHLLYLFGGTPDYRFIGSSSITPSRSDCILQRMAPDF